jgi:hypothetical protein
MKNPLVYQPTEIPKNCHFRISPSFFSEFVMRPHSWYRQAVLGEKSFEYNTSSILGTCVHYCADRLAKDLPVDMKVIEEYVNMHEAKEDYDPSTVLEMFVPMAETLVNDYVLPEKSTFLHSEYELVAEVTKGYAVAGTCDAIQGDLVDTVITDYKTYSSKTKPRAIPMNYRYQLLVYAWAAKKNGFNPTRIRLVYVNRPIDGGVSEKTGKPLKSYPSELTILTEQITQDDIDFIDSLLNLCVDSVEATKKHPELTHVIFHDYRLKEGE